MPNYGEAIRNGRAIGLLVSGVIMFFVMGPLIERCSKMPGSPSLQLGQRVMYQMAGRENLRQVGFFEEYEDARPSDFVELISDPESALWPPRSIPNPTPDALEMPGNASNRVLMPDVVFSAHDRQSQDSDEIVYVPDDANRKIIIRGYSPGVASVTFEYEWDFPTKAGKVPLR